VRTVRPVAAEQQRGVVVPAAAGAPTNQVAYHDPRLAAVADVLQADDLTALDDALASVPVTAATDTADVAVCLSRARTLFDKGDLARLVAYLPQLLTIAHVRAEQTQHPADYARSAACYDPATEALNKVGHLAASRITADRSMICARLSGSPIATAASARCLSIVLRHEGREQIADRITLDAAQAGDRDRALEMIADAEHAVIRLPAFRQDQPFNVSAAHVALYRVGVHWSLGDAGAAVNVGRRLHPGQFPTPERRGRLFTDLARAWWQWGKPEETVQSLLAAHSYAPAEVRDRASIRKIAIDLARRHPNVSGVQELTTALGLRAQSLLAFGPADKHAGTQRAHFGMLDAMVWVGPRSRVRGLPAGAPIARLSFPAARLYRPGMPVCHDRGRRPARVPGMPSSGDPAWVSCPPSGARAWRRPADPAQAGGSW
jgi:hypothetical protein